AVCRGSSLFPPELALSRLRDPLRCVPSRAPWRESAKDFDESKAGATPLRMAGPPRPPGLGRGGRRTETPRARGGASAPGRSAGQSTFLNQGRLVSGLSSRLENPRPLVAQRPPRPKVAGGRTLGPADRATLSQLFPGGELCSRDAATSSLRLRSPSLRRFSR